MLVDHLDDRLFDDHLDVDTFLTGLNDDLFDNRSCVVDEVNDGFDLGHLNLGVEPIGRLDKDSF